ncbi:hypothetical protein D3C78_354300 [compost metagenome]
MPEITITQAFHFREGGEVRHYPASRKPVPVSAAVASHALERNFARPPKAAEPMEPLEPVLSGDTPDSETDPATP